MHRNKFDLQDNELGVSKTHFHMKATCTVHWTNVLKQRQKATQK